MTAIDLYSGIGGLTLGSRMAGIRIASSHEWWKDANNTDNKNFGTVHKEKNIRELRLDDLSNPDAIQFVIGVLLVHTIAFANRGGNGGIKNELRNHLGVS